MSELAEVPSPSCLEAIRLIKITRPAGVLWRRTMFSLASLCTGVAMMSTLFIAQAEAFKVETHIWIAQQLINDLSVTDSFTFDVGGKEVKISVRKEVRQAILDNQEVFRLGSIGPDAFPGIYEGQMTIHPGSNHIGWGAGHWFEHLLKQARSPEELAFAYGALTHAAGDIFAHTYVNQYAGDLYLLTDKEWDVERRHYLLEGFIASKMPALRDASGKPMPPISELIAKQGTLPIPADLLRRAFLEDEGAANELERNGSGHFAAIHSLNRELASLTRDGGPLDRVYTLTQQLMITYYTGLQVKETDLKKLNEAHQRIRDITNDGIDKIQDLDKAFRDQSLKLLKGGNKLELDTMDQAEKYLREVVKLNAEKARYEEELAKVVDDLSKLVDPCTRVDKEACRNVIDVPCVGRHPIFRYSIPPGCGSTRRICEHVVETVCTIHELRPELNDLRQAKENLVKLALSNVSDNLKKYKEAIDAVHRGAQHILKADAVLLHAGVDFLQRFTKDINPAKSLLIGWLADNKTAMNAYFTANGDAIKNAMTQLSPFPPLKRWVLCELPKIRGTPHEVIVAGCALRDTIAEMHAIFDQLEKLAASNVPVFGEIVRIRATVEKAIAAAAKKEIINFASRVTGVEIQNLLDILVEKPTAEMLNSEFSREGTVKSLVTFNNVADRLEKEMFLTGDGTFDTQRYTVIHNAMVLARLALLDENGLNTIAGKELYGKKSNIIFRFASSIDGNHQWLPKSPPYPRKTGIPICGDSNGYPTGFPLWNGTENRKIFMSIFKGPLSPALETPTDLGLEPALPEAYPYKPTAKNPYPNWTTVDDNNNCVDRSRR